MNRATILIIDDTPLNLDVLFKHLDRAGYKTLVAVSGQRGITQAINFQPDLILLDVMMPEMDGFEVCSRLKQDERTQSIPIIFITALSDMKHIMKGFEKGGVDYITKPFYKREVLARVNTHLTLRRQVAELDAFAHTVAHDLKGPLSAISLSAELLLSNYERPSARNKLDSKALTELSDSIRRSAMMATEIIDSLLLLALINREKVDIEPVSMEAVVSQALFSLDESIKKTQASIEVPDTWPVVLGYEPWLERVWSNYLSNALKYSGDKPQITLGVDEEPQKKMVRFWVKDNGLGITEEEQSTLFTEFTRLHNTTATEGHGLGLAIVKRIIERLGGKVGVSSELGEGSTFYFSLPTPSEDPSV